MITVVSISNDFHEKNGQFIYDIHVHVVNECLYNLHIHVKLFMYHTSVCKKMYETHDNGFEISSLTDIVIYRCKIK